MTLMPNSIQITNLTKRFGDFCAVYNVDLFVEGEGRDASRSEWLRQNDDPQMFGRSGET
jgi:hypothetical protein